MSETTVTVLYFMALSVAWGFITGLVASYVIDPRPRSFKQLRRLYKRREHPWRCKLIGVLMRVLVPLWTVTPLVLLVVFIASVPWGTAPYLLVVIGCILIGIGLGMGVHWVLEQIKAKVK